MRLDKWLSDATSYTRSQLKQLIRSGQVTVNQTIVKKPETPVQETDVICLQGNPVEPVESCYCLLLNKPLGYVCAVTDATEKTVMELIPPELQRKGLFPVGRLDKDTSGMLLLTNDGAFSHALLAPKRHVPKYYRMQLARPYEESYAQWQSFACMRGNIIKCGGCWRQSETMWSSCSELLLETFFYQLVYKLECVRN